jgi:RNA 2',3'-cyclic 3'-phosphodiesterase
MTGANRERGLRLFVACELPPAVRDALGRVQEELRARGAGRLRWVRPEAVHLTLKFLGEVPVAKREAVENALAAAVVAPFALDVRLGSLGGFGGRQRLRVIWVGLEGDVEGLAELAALVEEALGPMGFPREGRPFAPHLTLARVPDDVDPQERSRLADLLEAFPSLPLPSMTLTAVSLMQSFLQPTGARYQCLAAYPAQPTTAPSSS